MTDRLGPVLEKLLGQKQKKVEKSGTKVFFGCFVATKRFAFWPDFEGTKQYFLKPF